MRILSDSDRNSILKDLTILARGTGYIPKAQCYAVTKKGDRCKLSSMTTDYCDKHTEEALRFLDIKDVRYI